MPQEHYLKRVCPVCGGAPDMSQAVSSQRRAESMSLESLTPYWNGFFKEKVFFSYAPCQQCGLLFAPVFFTPEQLEKLYGQMAPNMSEVPIEALRRTQRGYFATLKRYSTLDGAFIEVGPDIGLFTENCVREGRFEDYWLFEPNRDVEATLRGAVAGKRVHVVHDMFGFDAVPDLCASAAVMVHVLDHLLDPVATLSELRRKLRPNAHLLIVTHDESSLLRKLVGWRWPAFCLQHPEIYNPRSISTLLKKAGFKVVAQHKTVNYFQLSFLVKHMLWALGLKVSKVPSFGGYAPGLKLGNLLTMASPS